MNPPTPKEPTPAEVGFLRMLARGDDFTLAVAELGEDGVRVAFSCIANGWVDRGVLTKEGLSVATRPGKANYEIRIVPGKESTRKP